jgi:hypothetical protein
MPAASQLYEVIPRHTQFQIGRDLLPTQLNDPLVGIIKREGIVERGGQDPEVPALNAPARILLCCAVRNTGSAAFTLECEQSANNFSDGEDPDNADTGPLTPDAYADIPIRIDGSDVATGDVVVQPGAVVVFLIEWDETHDDYIKFGVPEEAAFGELAISHYNGTLVTRGRVGVI